MFQEVTFRAQKIKKPTLQRSLMFQEMKRFNPKLKKFLFFLGEPFRVFHHCFYRYFHFTIDFCFRVFSLLIAFVHFITVSLCIYISPLILLLFFECFHFTNFLYRDCILSGTLFLCCCTRVLRIWESCFRSQAFLLNTFSQHLTQPAFIKASLGPAVLP